MIIDTLHNKSIKRPKVPATFHQLGIFVLDGSGSMQERAAGNVTKAQAVNQAMCAVFTRFRTSRLRSNFSFAVVTFDYNAQVHTGVTAADDIDDHADYDPTVHHGGATDIASGLTAARRLAEDFLHSAPSAPPASVVIVLMSDGRDGDGAGDPATTRRLADELKRNKIKICTTYFPGSFGSEPLAEQNLRALSSDPTLDYAQVHDAQTLRDFFIRSTSSVVTLS